MERKIDVIIGEDTIATVLFDYTPSQPPIYHGTSMQPEMPAEVEINAVMVGNGDFMDDLNDAALERIKQDCFESIAEGERPDDSISRCQARFDNIQNHGGWPEHLGRYLKDWTSYKHEDEA